MSLYVMDTEGDDLLDNISKFHCFVLKELGKDNWHIFTPTGDVVKRMPEHNEITYQEHKLGEFSNVISKSSFTGLLCHNILGFDLPAMKKLGYIESYSCVPDHINSIPKKIFDTLHISRCLYPDRQLPRSCPTHKHNPVTGKKDPVGPHGLDAWGYRVANAKPKVDDWRNQPIEVYVHRCIEDVKINELTWFALIKESKDLAKDSKSQKGAWSEPMKMSHKQFALMNEQALRGVPFDKAAAEKLLERVDNWMEELANEVESQLPLREVPKSKRPQFPAEPFKDDGTISAHGWNWLRKLGYPVDDEILSFKSPPKTAFKQTGEVSKAGERYCERAGITDPDKMAEYLRECKKKASLEPLPPDLMEKAIKDLKDKKEPDMMEPMKISNQADIKQYLVEVEGWNPLFWRTKDITRDSNKRNLSESAQTEKAIAYIEEIKESPYKKFISEEMNIDFDKTPFDKLLDKVKRQGRYLCTTPQLKDDRKELCPNLANLKGDMAKKIVLWLSLRNRRSVIKALDENKETGWLNHPRVDIDGRLPASSSGLTNTHRQKHSVVNL